MKKQLVTALSLMLCIPAHAARPEQSEKKISKIYFTGAMLSSMIVGASTLMLCMKLSDYLSFDQIKAANLDILKGQNGSHLFTDAELKRIEKGIEKVWDNKLVLTERQIGKSTIALMLSLCGLSFFTKKIFKKEIDEQQD